MIAIRDVGKVYPGHNGHPAVTALDGVTLEVGNHEFLSLLGPSGCGKTTLLKIVGGLEEASSGSVSVDGFDTATARLARSFGFVFQDPVLFEWRTVLENVRLPGEISHEMSMIDRAKEALEMVGLQAFERAFPHQLSGGMRSRVAIARALALQPRVMLMDEPFADLDELTRTRLNLELLRIWEATSATIVFVTHSIREAVFLSDRVVVLGNRPARIESVFDVEFRRPRTIDLLDSPEFVSKTAQIRRLIASWGE